MTNFDRPVDHAWRAYRALLKAEGVSAYEEALAQEAFKQGWHEGEASGRAKQDDYHPL